MIYTVTFNPALDYIVNMDNIKLGETNRSTSEMILSGGKGINVSIVLKNLGFDNIALGFVAGFTGKEIENGTRKLGITTDFIHLKEGLSRINVKLKADKETEVNGTGPIISKDELNALYGKLENLKKDDILVLAGSVPNTLPQDIYEKIMGMLQDKGIKIVVDATKDLLLNVLKYKPFLIKPNNHELSEIFGVEIKTEEEIIDYAKKLQDKGARNVLISRAGDGAILIAENGDIYKSPAPKGKVINSVGAGDSMVAGFIAGYLKNNSYEEAFKTGVASGSASAFSKYLAKKEEILEILNTL
ncbi:MAG: 1-phosphofructokinase [Tyzzerella sp.]|uniref:Tagatose-6-phosphate kinase n=1 Tax=Candidatus Fimicola merdigallinarum TaxID=2840819 RepID=A0A9D9DWF0_9FIRM|nr:1-phosphofructokinase [Candidatus Fimicola merdigallinarum]